MSARRGRSFIFCLDGLGYWSFVLLVLDVLAFKAIYFEAIGLVTLVLVAGSCVGGSWFGSSCSFCNPPPLPQPLSTPAGGGEGELTAIFGRLFLLRSYTPWGSLERILVWEDLG